MKTILSKRGYPIILFVLSSMLIPQELFPQSADSLTQSLPFEGGIQFQLIGGMGIYYIGNLGSGSHFRVGADLSLSNSNQSGNRDNYSFNYFTAAPYSNSSIESNKPHQKVNTYTVSVSGLYLQNLVKYKHATIYCGVGPIIDNSWSRSTDDYTDSYTFSSGNIYTTIENDETTSKSMGAGPLLIFGIKSQLFSYVQLTAEFELSALYQWNSQTSSTRTTTTGSTINSSTTNSDNVSHLSGWAITLNPIRIGVIIEL